MTSMPENTTFLIVDDCDIVLANLKEDLNSLGFSGTILEAQDGNIALLQLKKAKETTPVQFIISDMEMPNCTGLEFLKKIKDHAEFKNLPFLMLTNNSDRNTVMQAIAAGASNYLLKPWNKQSLAEKIAFSWGKAK